jgi:heme-degrading monooxygenase HmoA
MHARVSTLQLDPSRVDESVNRLKEEIVPELEQANGFKGFTAMVDRQSGKVIGVSFWESDEAMRGSEELGQSSRQRAGESGGATGEPQVERLEVVVDTMA